jgi:hypothetical protein
MSLASGEEQPWNNVESKDEKFGPEATPLKNREQADYKSRDES